MVKDAVRVMAKRQLKTNSDGREEAIHPLTYIANDYLPRNLELGIVKLGIRQR